MKKFICLHGHFYQPPRENPWTGEVEPEPSAAPFHDWNERISKECYQANAQAPILDPSGQIAERVNNFASISFDIGPTLLYWLRLKDPATYQAILDADQKSAQERSGHGNAIAQSYNHLIMPLASRRDKVTQVVWGIRDFEFHYKRKPKGMWLPETAVDRETLSVLAEQGIRFTILSPHQASRIRPLGIGSRWQTLQHESIDTKQPYRIILDQGRQLHLFFYDAPISREIAFGGLLNNGDELAHRLTGVFGWRDREQFVSAAVDGETFGHHHRFGEMAVAYAFKKINREGHAKPANFGEFLERGGSFWEVDIHERSSWSCVHGVERWRSDCGCRIEAKEGADQRWRAVLRESFDFLKGIVDDIFDSQGAHLVRDPWEARNDYIGVLLEDSPGERTNFLRKHAVKKLGPEEEAKVWDLLEAEKLSLFMFTSCGWFFDELSGIEPALVMKFAARAIQRIRPYAPAGFGGNFFNILRQARSSDPAQGNGEDIFKRVTQGE